MNRQAVHFLVSRASKGNTLPGPNPLAGSTVVFAYFPGRKNPIPCRFGKVGTGRVPPALEEKTLRAIRFRR